MQSSILFLSAAKQANETDRTCFRDTFISPENIVSYFSEIASFICNQIWFGYHAEEDRSGRLPALSRLFFLFLPFSKEQDRIPS